MIRAIPPPPLPHPPESRHGGPTRYKGAGGGCARTLFKLSSPRLLAMGGSYFASLRRRWCENFCTKNCTEESTSRSMKKTPEESNIISIDELIDDDLSSSSHESITNPAMLFPHDGGHASPVYTSGECQGAPWPCPLPHTSSRVIPLRTERLWLRQNS